MSEYTLPCSIFTNEYIQMKIIDQIIWQINISYTLIGDLIIFFGGGGLSTSDTPTIAEGCGQASMFMLLHLDF